MSALLVEAFALPIFVERAKEQKPHAEYEYKLGNSGDATVLGRIYISNKASTVCRIPDED